MEFLAFVQPFLLPPLALFTGVLAVVLLVALIELALLLVAGSGISDAFESVLPVESLATTPVVNWLLIGEVPLLVALLLLASSFGAAGLLVQSAAGAALGGPLYPPLAFALAAVVAIGSTRYLVRAISRLGLVSTTALPPGEFIGQTVTLCSPEAAKGNAGEASFTDRHGYTHYLMVEPLADDVTFAVGDHVVVRRQASLALYLAEKA